MKINNLKHNFSLITLIALLACSCKQPVKESPRKDALTIKIDNLLQESVTRMNIAGLTIAATRNDSIVYHGAFGYRNVDTMEPMKEQYNFHWASVSKTFVATAIMQLVEQGKINLDEKLVTYLPYFKQKKGDYEKITIRQMLNHTSGIGDVDDYEWNKPQYADAAPELYVKSLEKDEMLFMPGEDWSYSNNAYEILGVVITKLSGIPFETYVRKNILDPLEMPRTSFFYSEIPDSLRVKGHVWAGKPMVSKVYPYNRIHAPSSTLNSSVLEMTHYAIANLHRGEYNGKHILSDSIYNLLWNNSVHLKDTTKPKVGISWFLDHHKGLKTMSHGGGDTGFRSFLLLVPEKNISIEVASNYELGKTRDFGYAVLDLLLGAKPEIIKSQIGFSFAEILKKDGLEKAKAYYKETESDSSRSKYFIWTEDEGALTYPAYLLMDEGMLQEAVQVFKFNLAINPTSGYAHGHLGVSYAKLGDKKLARINLTKAIELIPTEKYYKDELEKLDR
jgi:CubicO group peptidase (beta-lactamase class C family)